MSITFSDGLRVSTRVVGIHTRTHFSLQHIKNASYFCRQLLEEDKQSRLANATGALFSSTAYIEATANELLSKTEQKRGKHLGKIEEEKLVEIAKRVNDLERKSALEKLKYLVDESGFGPFDLGNKPSQDIDRMFQVRNGLIHYKAYWLDTFSDNMIRDNRSLVKTPLGKFLKDKFVSGDGFETDKWLNRKFAEWCVHSSVDFIDYVFGLFDGIPFHDHIRDELKTKPCDS